MSSPTLTMKCKCGAFEATFDSPPRVIFNCQCRSCVSVVKSIEAREGFSGTSIKCDDESGGAAIAIYKSNNNTVVKSDKESIGFMKVGEEGKIPRAYCNKCGTVLFNVYAPNWCAVNRNALTNADGEPFVPEGEVMNVNCKSAFDASKVTGPKHNMVPFRMLLKFIPLLAGFGVDGSNTEENLIPEDMSKVEVSPITWE
mmetsp:Transcript_25502/g.43231  ORF Transcript_25502/g.43231 Transcript_25502/m.43231 type:complete len:199 (+) Transcript_25502:138-734(+)